VEAATNAFPKFETSMTEEERGIMKTIIRATGMSKAEYLKQLCRSSVERRKRSVDHRGSNSKTRIGQSALPALEAREKANCSSPVRITYDSVCTVGSMISEGRLASYIAGWWEFVDQNGNPVGDGGVEQSAGTSSKFSKGVGNGVTAYLMRIPKDFWLDDQIKKEQDLKEREQDMKRSVKQVGDYGKVDVSIRT